MSRLPIEQITIPFCPRWYQSEAHALLRRFSILVWHRRSGKTVLAVNKLIRDLVEEHLPNPRVGYLCPFRNQAKRVVWLYVKQFMATIPGVKFNEADLTAKLPGGRELHLLGMDKGGEALRGGYFDSVVCDEFADVAPSVWGQVIRPMLMDRDGKALIIGTPKGMSNIFYRIWEQSQKEGSEWFGQMLTCDDTDAIKQSEVDAVRLELDADEFMQEMFCSFTAAIKGAFYGSEMVKAEDEGRIRDSIEYDETIRCITSWDLGIRDATVIWIMQPVAGEIRVLECRQYRDSGLPEIIKDLQSLPYQYEEHIGPHDLRVRELGSGQSRIEICDRLGVAFTVAPNIPVQDGISATRAMLSRCYFDKIKCADGLEALRNYRCEYDDNRRTFRLTPRHDWTSDFADALRYFAVTNSEGVTSTGWQTELDYSELDRAVI